MFEALVATNEAIMRAQTRDELFELVCQAAVKGGNFTATLIGMAEPGSDFLRIAATAGPTAETAKSARLAITAEQPEGRGLTGGAFHTGPAHQQRLPRRYPTRGPSGDGSPRRHAIRRRPAAASRRSTRRRPTLHVARAGGVSARARRTAATTRGERSVRSREFDRADDGRLADEQAERLTRMFAALSATNEAIMRAATRAELFQLVCEAAAQGGRFTSTIIALAEPGSDFLNIVATAGPNAELSKTLRLATTTAHPEGRGLSGTAFRTRQPLHQQRLSRRRTGRGVSRQRAPRGQRSCAALPLLSHGEAVGVLLFLSSELGAFTTELVELLQRLAENVSFALENFDRADERRLADQQKERLTRMYTALSATNEAIMRARTRDELFELVCEAAVNGGKFAVATSSLWRSPARISCARSPAAGPTAQYVGDRENGDHRPPIPRGAG